MFDLLGILIYSCILWLLQNWDP